MENPAAYKFDGADVVPARDNARLTGQIERVYDLMKDGAWRTVSQISHFTKDPETSVSAQLRNLRKTRFGGHTVDRKHIGGGQYAYRLLVNQSTAIYNPANKAA